MGNGFRKNAVAAAIAIATMSAGLAGSVQAEADTLVVNSNKQTNRLERTGILLKVGTNFFGITNNCYSTSLCTFTNKGNVDVGEGAYAVTLDDQASYRFSNSAAITAAGKTAVFAGSGAGNLTFVNNQSGTINATTAFDYQASNKFILTSSGNISGNINVALDNDEDKITFFGGFYKGAIQGVEQVIVNGKLKMTGSLNLSGLGATPDEKFLKVVSNRELTIRDLTLNNGVLKLDPASTLAFQLGKANELSVSNTVASLSLFVPNGVNASAGKAQLAQGKLKILAPSGMAKGQATDYLLIEALDADDVEINAAALNASNSDRVGISAFHSVVVTNDGSGDIIAKITRNNADPMEEINNNNQGSKNGAQGHKEANRASKDALNAGGARQEKAEKLQRAILSKTSVEELARLAEEIIPSVNRGAIAASKNMLALSNRHVAQRINTGRQGLNTGDYLDSGNVWLQGLYSDGSQKNRKRSNAPDVKGYDSRFTGYTLGLDTVVMNEWLVGAAFSVSQGEINKRDVRDRVDIKGYTATLYANWPFYEKAELDLFVNYGLYKNDRKRYVDVTGTDLNLAESQYDSHQYGIKAIASYPMAMEGFQITPLAGLHYSHFQVDAYKEKDIAAVALANKRQSYEIAEAGLGVEIKTDIKMGSGVLIPEVKLMGWHDFQAEAVEVTSRFLIGGDQFVSKGLKPEKTSWSGLAGLTWKQSDTLEFSVGYEKEWRKGYQSDNYFAQAHYQF